LQTLCAPWMWCDAVGGPSEDELIALAKPGGAFVSAVAPPNGRLAAEHKVRAEFFIVDVNGAQLAAIAEMVERSKSSCLLAP
jgi:hypothetical protein